MKKDDTYKGFRVIGTHAMENNGGTGIHLVHEKSGMEVFHVLNDDSENLFAFVFRTPVHDDTGVAHVLEHSVLCGSERYPFKDPFIKLEQQSVSTYLNAFTASDRTAFPASSTIKKDYFNIMSVYSDAVFFPLLREETFLQEAWRMEFNQENEAEIQGIVYNEMKGALSSFYRLAGKAADHIVLKGTVYDNESGGDPESIPDLTPGKLREFHKEHYCPANCLVFLAGNIPTEEQLDFLDENVLSRIVDYGKRAELNDGGIPKKIKPFAKVQVPKEDESDGDKNIFLMTWNYRDKMSEDFSSQEEFNFGMLSYLLWENESSYLSKTMIESFPEASICHALTGAAIADRYSSCYFALENIAESDVAAAEKKVWECLEHLAEEGIPEDEIKNACQSYSLSLREIRRNYTGGPYSFVHLQRVIRAWTYHMAPETYLDVRSTFDAFRKRIESDKGYLQSLIRKILIENKSRSTILVCPSAELAKKRDASEKRRAKSILRELGEERIRSLHGKMLEFQRKDEDTSSMPRLAVPELEVLKTGNSLKRMELSGIPVFTSTENTGGVTYANLLFPIDTLSPAEYKFIPLLCECMFETGWKNVDWTDGDKIISEFIPSISADAAIMGLSAPVEKIKNHDPLVQGRHWLKIAFKFLDEDMENAFRVLGDCMTSLDFADTARIDSIMNSMYSAIYPSLATYSSHYAGIRIPCRKNRDAAAKEIIEGITSVFSFLDQKKAGAKAMSKKMRSLYRKIVGSGAIFHVMGTKKTVASSGKAFEEFARRMKLSAPKERRCTADEEFFRQINLPGETVNRKNPLVDELFVIPGNVSYAGCAVTSRGFGTKEFVSDDVLSHLLTTSDLWNLIRMEGGAYGVDFSVNSDLELSRFTTYRDPKPFRSLELFLENMKSLSQSNYSQETVDSAITGVYSNMAVPQTPRSRGLTNICNFLMGFSSDRRKDYIKKLLSIKEKDIAKSCRRYSEAEKVGTTVIFCGESMISEEKRKKCGKLIKIPI